MAAGDSYFTCENKDASLEQVLRTMVYNDGTGKPVISFNPNTTLQPWFQCDESKTITLEQLTKMLIVQDAAGKPAWNVNNS